MTGVTGSHLSQLFGPSTSGLLPLGMVYGDAIVATHLTGSDGMPAALDTLRAVVQEAGATLDNVARVTAYVPSVAERDAVYGPWDALFPDPNDRPAFKVLVASLPRGVAVRLDMLALRGGRRQRIDIEGVSARDPTVRIGDWIVTSRVHGTDPSRGKVAVGGVEVEARQAVANVLELVRLSGGQSSRISQLTGFVRDPAVGKVLGGEVSRSLREVPLTLYRNFVPPSMNLMLEAIAGRPGVREIVAGDGPIPDAWLVDDLLYAPDIRPARLDADFATQLESALQKMERVVSSGGQTRGNVAHVSVYFPDAALRPALNQVWERWFPDPDDRPPHKYVPVPLPEGQLVQLAVFAVHGARREVLEIPGVAHGDPMSMGVRMRDLLFSSRIFGQGAKDPETMAALVCQNVRALLARAGADPSQLTQVLAFVKTERDEAAARAAVDQLVEGETNRTKVQYLSPDLPGESIVRFEVIACLASGAA